MRLTPSSLRSEGKVTPASDNAVAVTSREETGRS